MLHVERRAILVDPLGQASAALCGSVADFARLAPDMAGREWGTFRVDVADGDDLADVLEITGCMRDVVIAVEELGWLIGQRWNPEPLEAAARFARHRRSPLVWTSQRIADVPPLLYAYGDLYLFRIYGQADLQAVARVTSRETADAVSVLPRFHGLRRAPDGKILDFSVDNPGGHGTMALTGELKDTVP